MVFQKGNVPWNVGKKLHYNVWNKDKHGVQVPWNLGLTKETDERVKESADKHRGQRLSVSGSNHPFFGKHHTKETKEKMRRKKQGKSWEEIFGIENIKKMKKIASRNMKIMNEERDLAKMGGIAYANKLKTDLEFQMEKCQKSSETLKNTHKKYANKFKEIWCKKGGRTAALKIKKLYPDLPQRRGLLSVESRRKNYPYVFMGCRFDSNEERKACELLVRNGIIDKPKERVNVHFRVGNGEIDFFVQRCLFIEYHPPNLFFKSNSLFGEEYYKQRRILLNKNGFKDIPLVVLEHLNEFNNKILPFFENNKEVI